MLGVGRLRSVVFHSAPRRRRRAARRNTIIIISPPPCTMMTASRSLGLVHRHACLTIFILLTFALNVTFVTSFSAVPRNARVPSFVASTSKATAMISSSGADSNTSVAAVTPASNKFGRQAASIKTTLIASVISCLFRLICSTRKSIARAFAVFSLAFISFASHPRPAIAWGKTAETSCTKVVEAPISSSANKRCLKCIVTAGAVAAGAASARKIRGLSLNTTDDEKDDAPQAAAEADTGVQTVQEPPKLKPPNTYRAVSNAPLIKDLDSKIDRLREQDRLAIQLAADNIAKDEAAKAEKMAQDAVTDQKNKVEERIARIAEEEANKIAAIEKERKEQLRLAQEKIAAEEKERLERISELESQVNQAKIEEEMKHKVTQSSEPSHADESRTLVEQDAAKRKEEDRRLAEKYAAMKSDEERAFNILVDLGMVELHTDPDEFPFEDDDNIDPSNVFQ